ncbi:unnamed protein product [Clonostachys rhizophaga]|uniref:Uncharacterized protein n=1 Tax=Clonostachys rhizophaga TaxID=160324 RepID=A0A9N9VJG8_9HYPO|nr:unnamed protein product [Clonostachys rhizophaga]
MVLFFSFLLCLLFTSGVVEAIKDQTWLGPSNAFDAGNSEQHPASSFLITSKNPSAFDIDCSSSGSDDGILKRSMSATEYSNLTGHRITLEVYQTSDCRDTNCEGQTSQRMLYDHDELFTHSSYISRKDRLQTVKIQWSRLVDGMSQAEYRIDKCGVITGSIDDRELTPFTFENASLATFLDGKPIPPLILPTSINETVTDVTLALLSAMKLCSGTQSGMLHVEDRSVKAMLLLHPLF